MSATGKAKGAYGWLTGTPKPMESAPLLGHRLPSGSKSHGPVVQAIAKYKGSSKPLSGTQYVRDTTGQYIIPGRHPGLVKRGNIDLQNRPVVKNKDGSISTVRSVSFGIGRREVLVPTVVDGKIVSARQALAEYRRTGRHLGTFDSPASANRYAEKLHEQQARVYGKRK